MKIFRNFFVTFLLSFLLFFGFKSDVFAFDYPPITNDIITISESLMPYQCANYPDKYYCKPHNGLVIVNRAGIEEGSEYASALYPIYLFGCIKGFYEIDGVTYQGAVNLTINTSNNNIKTLGTQFLANKSLNGVNVISSCVPIAVAINGQWSIDSRIPSNVPQSGMTLARGLWGGDSGYPLTCPLSLRDYIKTEIPFYILNDKTFNTYLTVAPCDRFQVDAGEVLQLVGKNWEANAPIAGPVPIGDFRLVFIDDEMKDYQENYELYSSNRCKVNMLALGIKKPFVCENPHLREVYNNGSYSLSYKSPYLLVDDLDDPCKYIVARSYDLFDTEGNLLCIRTFNPTISDNIKPYTPVINFNPDDHDWGAFNWFKTVVAFFAELINGITEWFYDLWINFLNLIIPTPDFFGRITEEIKMQIEEKMPLEALKNITTTFFQTFQSSVTSTPPPITGTFFGKTVTFVDFQIVDNFITQIRTLLIFSIVLTSIFVLPKFIDKLLDI